MKIYSEMYDEETGLPEDKEYLENELPLFLKNSIKKMVSAWKRLDAGEEDLTWDCDYCELQSDINIAEVEQLISSEQAWHLREKYLRIEKRSDLF